MRVIAGRLGGRRLAVPAGHGVRPTSDRVRESLFAVLGDVEGDRVLDLFAGSGALAIEALSRGAAAADLVERDARALQVIRRNVDALGLAEAVAVHRREALAFLRDAARAGRQYDLAFLDPPYRDAASLGRALGDALGPVLGPGARIVAESDRRDPLPLPWPPADERRYGDTLIRIHFTP
jgi:16S rRNA (guanine966-N2)-methyltransferase